MKKFELIPEETLLFVVDCQDSLINASCDKGNVQKNINILVKAFEEFNLPILFTEQYPKGLGHTNQEVCDSVKDMKVFEKNTFCALDNEEVLEALKATGKNHVVITGIETHICVLQTARAMLKLGYDVTVVKEAVSSRTVENKKAGLNLMEQMGATISTTETVLFDMLKGSKNPHFKYVQGLIK